MKTGRELDALVAEKVMGWEKIDSKEYERRFPHRKNRGVTTFSGEFYKFDGPWFYPPGWKIKSSAHENGCEVPNYSTDIAAAWEVVEKMKRRGSFIKLHNCENKLQWLCIITHPNDCLLESHAIEDSAPHAICLAALKAMGDTKDLDGQDLQLE